MAGGRGGPGQGAAVGSLRENPTGNLLRPEKRGKGKNSNKKEEKKDLRFSNAAGSLSKNFR